MQRVFLIISVCLAVLVAGCGSDDSSTTSSSGSGETTSSQQAEAPDSQQAEQAEQTEKSGSQQGEQAEGPDSQQAEAPGGLQAETPNSQQAKNSGSKQAQTPNSQQGDKSSSQRGGKSGSKKAPELTNKSKPQVEAPGGSPPQGLVVRDLAVGTGPEANKGDAVKVHYVGANYKTGEVFDASWDRGEALPFTLGSGGVIPGWEQGVEGMRVGGRRELIVPPDLGYSAVGAVDEISPNETLIFVIDLVAVE